MKKLTRILMMMLVLAVGTGITSCDGRKGIRYLCALPD